MLEAPLVLQLRLWEDTTALIQFWGQLPRLEEEEEVLTGIKVQLLQTGGQEVLEEVRVTPLVQQIQEEQVLLGKGIKEETLTAMLLHILEVAEVEQQQWVLVVAVLWELEARVPLLI